VIIQLKKGRDGPSTLACVRPDGTRTWGKVHPFLPAHDLTHCAVESVLQFHEAFFGLVASGWQIDDFAAPGASARLPAQAIWAEHIVGILDRERGLPQPLSATEFSETVAAGLSGQHHAPFRPLAEQELRAIRALRDALQARWHATAAGATLEVPFPATLA
jgi:hypothetical protein